MATRVTLQLVEGTSSEIPRPPRPADKGDTEPSQYIPKGMSDKDKKALREAALEWTDSLGGIMAQSYLPKRPAGVNMNHYRHGGGKDRTFGEGSVDELQDNLNPSGKATDNSVSSQFLLLIVREMKARGPGTRRYLARNATFGSPNRGTNWFGVTAEGDTAWYYAVGSFMMSYGAHAVRSGKTTTIRYRLFIYDRYNWDVEDGISKEVKVPSSIEWALDEDRTKAAEELQFNPYQKYFERIQNGEGYVVRDALMGSLISTGDAANFDVVGAGTVHWVRYEDSDPVPGTINARETDSGTER